MLIDMIMFFVSFSYPDIQQPQTTQTNNTNNTNKTKQTNKQTIQTNKQTESAIQRKLVSPHIIFFPLWFQSNRKTAEGDSLQRPFLHSTPIKLEIRDPVSNFFKFFFSTIQPFKFHNSKLKIIKHTLIYTTSHNPAIWVSWCGNRIERKKNNFLHNLPILSILFTYQTSHLPKKQKFIRLSKLTWLTVIIFIWHDKSLKE